MSAWRKRLYIAAPGATVRHVAESIRKTWKNPLPELFWKEFI
jgi:hypothetical protein